MDIPCDRQQRNKEALQSCILFLYFNLAAYACGVQRQNIYIYKRLSFLSSRYNFFFFFLSFSPSCKSAKTPNMMTRTSIYFPLLTTPTLILHSEYVQSQSSFPLNVLKSFKLFPLVQSYISLLAPSCEKYQNTYVLLLEPELLVITT